MRGAPRLIFALACCLAATAVDTVVGQDWPQWRGANRDARATGIATPTEWPEQLTKKWSIPVGVGVASPSLVGDKLYVFARQEGNEILRCLDAATGDEIWKVENEATAIRGPAAGFDGPRSSPTVADGKVVILGAQGLLTCLDAATGASIWSNDDNVGNVPRFATSSSPIVLDGLVITEFGEDREGGIAAYDLSTGKESWKWTDSGASYGSSVQMTIDGVEAIVAPMSDKLVVLAAADGKVLWQMPYTQGRYNAATPIVSDGTLIVAGPNSGMTALELTKQGDEVTEDQAWKNSDNTVIYNTPVLKDGKLYGISNLNSLFCINVEGGQTAWNAPLGGDAPARPQAPPAEAGQQEQGRRGGGGRGGRRGGGGGGGYGSVVDVGGALLALIPSGQLTVFAPGDEYTAIATYKVADAGAYAYPVPSKHGLFIKDQESVTLWATH
ncbi:Quinohemoprotein alcohol dehydrogenase ADH-IIG precursor [Pirellulimonas nuda]|uniref:Quinohemoprotein alcohol dehydrogenase ADH-IIG n=1 Tax=Pirellulimonas nuda TaxID=2528009 RepID=A0A518DE31_9BACT|nr:PQQ-binding-like beta-propeller repeat protein [Pirellulimonas nuda]QDU89729.1 Quinohemoprotein alcohol dehydrogenase ADH-IIG precursor [Pirellulimonas nuda]